jgi:hypothetical protein
MKRRKNEFIVRRIVPEKLLNRKILVSKIEIIVERKTEPSNAPDAKGLGLFRYQ